MGILAWIVLGGLAGWVASMAMGTNAKMGMLGNIIVGIVGAFLGGLIFNMLGGNGITGFNFYSFGVAFAGACVFLFAGRMIAGRN